MSILPVLDGPGQFYNAPMKSDLVLSRPLHSILLLVCLCVSVPSLAQTTPPASDASSADTVLDTPPVVPSSGTPAATLTGQRSASAVEKRFEYIRVEDSSARIDEHRLGGDTQSITVYPKGDMPAYQVAPVSGDRTWKVLGF